MSKIKDETIEQKNAQHPSVEDMLNGSKAVTDKAAVVSGMFFSGTVNPPVVYVQSNDRLIAVSDTKDNLSELCDAITATLSDNGITHHTSVVYGDIATCGKVWKVININL